MIYSIIGGTGTLGQELVKQLIKRFPTVTIRIFSRCELKQSQLKSKYNHPNLEFYIGDITRPQSLRPLKGSNIIFHVAALKQVDTLEFFPEEALNVNTIGTNNLINFCLDEQVEKLIFFTTDKAVDPINAYGYSKALAEKLIVSRLAKSGTSYLLYRWGNILGSRGSLFDSIQEQISKNRPIKITDFTMTRFWILIEDAVKFVLNSHLINRNKILIPGIKAAKVIDIIDMFLKVTKNIDHSICKIPIRPGEKYHENMYSDHDSGRLDWTTSKHAPQYTTEELRELIERWLCIQDS
jgi:FlaA1/EpsC-like NDP-sugar epimerase